LGSGSLLLLLGLLFLVLLLLSSRFTALSRGCRYVIICIVIGLSTGEFGGSITFSRPVGASSCLGASRFLDYMALSVNVTSKGQRCTHY
jgi:hypothetical protein